MPVSTRASTPKRDLPPSKESPKRTSSRSRTAKPDTDKNPAWGRTGKELSTMTILGVSTLFAICPLMVVYFWMACDQYGCSLWTPIDMVMRKGMTSVVLKTVFWDHLPIPTVKATQIFIGWMVTQALMYAFLPAKTAFGQLTPAGYMLPYKVNGLFAWVLTHALFVYGSFYAGWFKASIVVENWAGLLVCANVYGYALTAFAYIKSLYFPSHTEDRKFSGSFVYDMFMGVEFNPRFGELWDFKLFHNGRPGILAWTLINLSFAAAQYETIGYVTNSMLLVNWFHFCYVIDFFINEDWYVRTVDIAHDHFGFYLAWGDMVWLPWMYTLQTHYLLRNPVVLPTWAAISVFAIGMFGYYIFRAVNHQKDMVRRTDGKCEIWGKPARFIRAKYYTSDGKEHSSVLLASGWWGLARHFNYTGDLVLSFAMCAACGFQHLLPWFYVIYMTILLVQRIQRDHARCAGKYGKYWEEYQKLVPYNLIPYIY
jgi:7-dehydrocholesterol reductase